MSRNSEYVGLSNYREEYEAWASMLKVTMQDGYAVLSVHDGKLEREQAQTNDLDHGVAITPSRAGVLRQFHSNLSRILELRHKRDLQQVVADNERATFNLYCDDFTDISRRVIGVAHNRSGFSENAESSMSLLSRLNEIRHLLIEQKELLKCGEAELAFIECQIARCEGQMVTQMEMLDRITEKDDPLFQHCAQSFDDDESETSCCAPSIVLECLDHIQSENLAKDRLMEHQVTYEEEKADRGVRQNQGQSLTLSNDHFESQYQIKKRTLEEEHHAAVKQADQARESCLAEGHDLESYRWRHSSQKLSEAGSRPVSVIHEYSSAGRPSDGAVHLVRGEAIGDAASRIPNSGIDVPEWLTYASSP